MIVRDARTALTYVDFWDRNIATESRLAEKFARDAAATRLQARFAQGSEILGYVEAANVLEWAASEARK